MSGDRVEEDSSHHSSGHTSPDTLALPSQSVEDDEVEVLLPKGTVYSLNSRRLVADQLHRLAGMLNLPTNSTVAATRQLIEGKLLEMDQEPRNVQVIVSNDGGRLFLVAADGVISAEEEHVSGKTDEISSPTHQTIDTSAHELESLRSALREVRLESQQLQHELLARDDVLEQLRTQLATANAELERVTVAASETEIETLRKELKAQTAKAKKYWAQKCEQLLLHEAAIDEKDETIAAKDTEITRLQAEIEAFGERLPHSASMYTEHRDTGPRPVPALDTMLPCSRRGKAPPVDPFRGNDPEVRLDDWLPTLERAAVWNNWSEEERLIQLAGHLRGRASQEWNLLSVDEKSSFTAAVNALRARLDPGRQALAAQDFRHMLQRDVESVASYITRLERAFQIAYGHERLTVETRDAFLYSQLQAGLKLTLMESPAVSGSLSYRQLCTAAKQEEQRLLELKRHRQFRERTTKKSERGQFNSQHFKTSHPITANDLVEQTEKPARKCYVCGSTAHLARDCRQKRGESTPSSQDKKTESKRTAMAKTNTITAVETDPLNYLFSSDSEDSSVNTVRVEDKGSQPRKVTVDLQGLPVIGLIDSGADITIMNGDIFKKVAAIARLKKKAFKSSDKTPYGYDNKPFKLDGRIDLDITFAERTMRTTVYLKMDARDPLLLSEGVCHQLGIISYHPNVGASMPKVSSLEDTDPVVTVPVVRVKLIESVRLLPSQSKMVPVQLEKDHGFSGTVLIEPLSDDHNTDADVQLGCSLVNLDGDKPVKVLLTNSTGFTQHVDRGYWNGLAYEATPVRVPTFAQDSATVRMVNSTDEKEVEYRQKLLRQFLFQDKESPLTWQAKDQLLQVLLSNHDVFALTEGERGETDLVQMQIDTGNSLPRYQPVRRTPFAVREEIARQLNQMQLQGVISPSSSPWASPVVLVRKKDGSLRFCIDFRNLNAVTKPDVFPLPRIDDLLDQLGNSKFFSTLDLAAGYWQVQIHPSSKEKTAFITHKGLYQFNVMPFGLRNAPAVFQRLMQKVVAGLNQDDKPPFVSVYLDDILIFSETLEDHLNHLTEVISRLRTAGLKLKPAKCHFIRQHVEYLGHLITPDGISPNPARIQAVQDFPVPTSVKEVRQFVGLASYYRRFIAGFANIAQPLHNLTRKGAVFTWTDQCKEAFKVLKSKLISSPVLCYPDFSRSFCLETDASIKGLGAILSQHHSDGKLHPVAYASRALAPQEKKYAATEMETLAVVWAVSHFHAYLYGHDVVVYTDHSAVQAVLETPSPNGKHARWWSKLFGAGLKSIKIVYRAGQDNKHADALSRSPLPQVISDTSMSSSGDATVAAVQSHDMESIEHLLQAQPANMSNSFDLAEEQLKDPDLCQLIQYMNNGPLPQEKDRARKVAAQAPSFFLLHGILYFVDSKNKNRKRCVVPVQLRKQLMADNHSGPMAGHFSADKLYRTMAIHWWWQGMYADIVNYCTSCPQCAIVNSSGKVNRPPLHPIPVSRPFQIIGVDVMDLPLTTAGNRHVVVFQDFLTKFPLVFAVPDQKAIRLTKLLAEEVIPLFGVPEALLSDRGTNLLSHVMLDLCKTLGIQKLNTTAYHPQCDGMVERFNRTLKTILRKHAATYGNQWDTYLYGVLYAYRNVPHESTGEKPSYLLYGMDCKTPSEAAYIPPSSLQLTDIEDYKDEVTLVLSSARTEAAKSIQRAQQRYKKQYDRKSNTTKYHTGEWVLVRFPAEETGRNRKLSRPWHGPYRVTTVHDPDITVANVYFPQDKLITIHQTRVKSCPSNFPAGFYWYGGKRQGVGKVARWVETLLSDDLDNEKNQQEIDDQDEVHVDLEPENNAVNLQGTHEKLVPDNSATTRRATPYNLRKHCCPSKKAIEQARD